MSNFYIDPVNGNDANDGLGPYKAAYTSGGTTPIAVGNTVTGGTSGKTAKVVYITVTSGSWAGGDAAGYIYVGTPSGAFTNGEALLVGGSDLATLTADFVVSSWLTAKDGATAARIAPGDDIRFKKNNNAVSIGSATFTKGSTTVSISSRTLNICDCSSAWTPSANVTCSTDGSRCVDGNAGASVSPQASFTTGLMAYWPLGSTVDFSAYSKISLYMYAFGNYAAGQLQLCLCSDNAGATPVNTLNIPKIKESVGHNFLLDNGGALGDSIQSIALYAVSDPGTSTVILDNITATNDIFHGGLIGLNDGRWFPIKGIATDGTSVSLGMFENVHFHWTEATVTATAYFQDSYVVDADVNFIEVKDSGSSLSSVIKYSGGWNFSSDERDGDTFARSRAQTYSGITTTDYKYIEISHFHFSLFVHTLYMGSWDSGLEYIKVDSVSGCQFSDWFYWSYYGCRKLYLTGTIYAVGGHFIGQRPTDSYSLATVYSDATIEYIPIAGNGSNSQFMGCVAAQDVFFSGKVSMKAAGDPTWDKSGSFITHPLGNWYFAEVVLQFPSAVFTFANYFSANRLQIDKMTINDGVSYFITTTNNCHSFNAHIMNLILGAGVTLSNSFSTTSPPYPQSCVKVDRLNADGRFARYYPAGTVSDQVTGGQAEAWAQGGSGSCLYMNPSKTSWLEALIFDSYVFAPTAGSYKLKFDVKKTSGAADCVLKVSAFGNAVTPIRRETVTLTDSWASWSSAAFTTEYAGFVHVFFEAVDGATTGDIGIDNIELEAQ